MRTVVLVEGESDRRALETLARRVGVDLREFDVAVVAMGGATNVGRFTRELDGARLLGLCDAAEAPLFRRALGEANVYVCTKDLEDELIRALGADRVVQAIEAGGDLTSFRTMQHQPFHRDAPVERQLRRFMGTTSGRKAKYAEALVDALDLGFAPEPLERLLAACRA